MPRFVTMYSDQKRKSNYGNPDYDPQLKISDSILEQIGYWHCKSEDANNKTEFLPFVVPYDSDAWELIRTAQTDTDDAINSLPDGSPLRLLLTRKMENLRKLALIKACSDDFRNPVIGVAQVEWANRLISHSIQLTAYRARNSMFSSPHEKHCFQILNFVKKSGGRISKKSVYFLRYTMVTRIFETKELRRGLDNSKCPKSNVTP